ncbi:MAG: hypothetical protein RMJ98_11570, partial [Myxococcales bacterium]|nr:hypothetical protein [Polyangiaceae bacterium]MDW8249926.1 hypothetical protein [Myxococcales bacterium]
PTPQLLLGNDVPGWPTNIPPPHFGLGLSEAFLNYAMGSLYNSGILCLQLSTDQVAQLNANALGLLIPSFKTLPLQKQNAPVGLVMKPTNPPTVKVGTGADPKKDPTLTIDLKGLGIDFYVWSSDRYIRAFSASFDLGVPVNLSVSKEGLTPQISDLAISGMKITNSELLSESPAKIAGGLEGLLGAAVGQALGGGLSPIDLSGALASLGFTLNIPESVDGGESPGIRKLTEGSHNFLGIFASLGLASAQPQQYQLPPQVSRTSARIIDRKIDPAGLRITTANRSNAPTLLVSAASSLAGQKIQYTYRVNKGFWRPWTTSEQLEIRDDMLQIQGKHTIYVKSRVQGQPLTEDPEPIAIPVTLDVEPPRVQLRRDGNMLAVRAVDDIAEDAELKVRHAIDQGPFTDWEPYHEGIRIPSQGNKVTVEVKDGEENIATVSHALRGKVDETGKASSDGCGCSIPGQSRTGSWQLCALGIAGALPLVRSRRRRLRRLREVAASITVMVVAGSWSGCSCSDDSTNTDLVTPPAGGAAGEGSGGSQPALCNPDDGCETLQPGLVGSYTSAAVASDGTLWIAGYNEGDFNAGYPYGDLVVGKYLADKNAVEWKTVDGMDPNEEVDPTAYNIEGWRGGRTNPGPDVGLWTSIAIGEGDKPMVAYYDVTNGALKFASLDGDKWSSYTLQQKPKAQIGRYAKMLLVGGKPVIAYFFYEPGQGGFAISGVRVARAKSAVPTAPGDWTFEDAFVNQQTPCRASLCEGNTKCNLATGKCQPVVDGCDKCGSDAACFAGDGGPQCQAIATAAKPEAYLNATGLYVAAALLPSKSDIGLAFYDRIRGNVWVAKKEGTWVAKLVDGQNGDNPGTDTGDMGIGTSLAIDDKGDWHLAYVSGLDETLRYLFLPQGNPSASSTVVDYGGPPNVNEPSADKNLVGDDSSIRVAGGKITIAYQNATAGRLRVAISSDGKVWSRTEVQQPGKFAGYFSQQVGGKLINFWRVGGAKIEGDVAVLNAP